MTAGWQKLHVPMAERLALIDISYRLGVPEDEVLRLAIRDFVLKEIANPSKAPAKPEVEAPPCPK